MKTIPEPPTPANGAAALAILESDCVLVLARGRRAAVLTEPPATVGALSRLASTLRALGIGPAGAGTAILLGPASGVADLSFARWRGAPRPPAGVELDDLALPAALAARLVGRLLADLVVLVAAPPGQAPLRLTPPRCWWHGIWRIRRRRVNVRVAARLLFHGTLVLG